VDEVDLVEEGAAGSNSTRKSTSLSALASPRATEPNTQMVLTPRRWARSRTSEPAFSERVEGDRHDSSITCSRRPRRGVAGRPYGANGFEHSWAQKWAHRLVGARQLSSHASGRF